MTKRSEFNQTYFNLLMASRANFVTGVTIKSLTATTPFREQEADRKAKIAAIHAADKKNAELAKNKEAWRTLPPAKKPAAPAAVTPVTSPHPLHLFKKEQSTLALKDAGRVMGRGTVEWVSQGKDRTRYYSEDGKVYQHTWNARKSEWATTEMKFNKNAYHNTKKEK